MFKNILNHTSNNQQKQPAQEAVLTNNQALNAEKAVTKSVDVLVIGGGPAALGMLVNAVKTNR